MQLSAESVRAITFDTHRLGRGYDMAEVDAFLDRVVGALSSPPTDPLTAADVRAVTFTARHMSGYDEAEVDAFLDDAELTLAQLGRG